MINLVYLASPYYHDNSYVMQERYEAVSHAVMLLTTAGISAISPVTVYHPFKKLDYKFNQTDSDLSKVCSSILYHCDAMYVLTLNGWKDSIGVKAEVEMARGLFMPVRYYSTEDLIKEYV